MESWPMLLFSLPKNHRAQKILCKPLERDGKKLRVVGYHARARMLQVQLDEPVRKL